MKYRVYNNHPNGLTHREKFRDEMIEIKCGDYVLMDYEDAVIFRGQYFPIIRDAMGQQDPKSFKVIKLVPDESVGSEKEKEIRYVCHLDGKEFPTKSALEAHMKQNYSDTPVVIDEALEAELVKKKTGRSKSTEREAAV